MKVHGQCHCAAIAFEADVDPERVTICHCTDCQTLTGTAFRVSVPTRIETFVLLKGTPKIYRKTTADSGNVRLQAFCGNCGTPIYTAAAHDAQTYGLRVGTLAERARLAPRHQKWCRSALPWSMNVADLPRAERE
ncbi:MAG TPA: GFA family protein [Casimicrobiaceae bacterium]|jgi:hypothetical protein